MRLTKVLLVVSRHVEVDNRPMLTSTAHIPDRVRPHMYNRIVSKRENQLAHSMSSTGYLVYYQQPWDISMALIRDLFSIGRLSWL